MKAVKLTKLVQEMNLKNLTPEVDMEHVQTELRSAARISTVRHFSWQAILNILPASGYRLLDM